MRQMPLRVAFTLLGVLLVLSGCQSLSGQTQAQTTSAPTSTTPIATATTTPAPAPTPTNVPAGWTVMTGIRFSMAYPPDWNEQTVPSNDGAIIYTFIPPNAQNEGVRVDVTAPQGTSQGTSQGTPQSANLAPYCLPPSGDVQHTTLAGLPMVYMVTGEGLFMRTWTFVTAQGTLYTLDGLDAQGTPDAQARDAAVLGTFRPDNSSPWQC